MDTGHVLHCVVPSGPDANKQSPVLGNAGGNMNDELDDIAFGAYTCIPYVFVGSKNVIYPVAPPGTDFMYT